MVVEGLKLTLAILLSFNRSQIRSVGNDEPVRNETVDVRRANNQPEVYGKRHENVHERVPPISNCHAERRSDRHKTYRVVLQF